MSYYHDDLRHRREDWDRRQERDLRDPWEQPGRAPGSAPSLWGPAAMLFILALLNVLAGLGGAVSGAYFNAMSLEDFQATMPEEDIGQALDDSSDPWTEEDQTVFVWTVFALGAGSLLAAVILAGGAFAMIARKFYALAMLSAITAFVSPGGCCILGVVGGIWSLIALIDPHVKRSFT
jgi:hypothetical protein